MTLREAIEQAIALGETDPQAIASQVIARYGEEVVLAEFDVSGYAADFARRVIGENRRGGIRSIIRAGAAPTKRQVMLEIVWLRLRIAAKDFLRRLWIASRHSTSDAHGSTAGGAL